jgi:hypothetical protein
MMLTHDSTRSGGKRKLRIAAALLGVVALMAALSSTAGAVVRGAVLANVDKHAVRLTYSTGAPVRALHTGRYSVIVRDRSFRQNFHLIGPGRVSRKTTFRFVGSVKWSVKFAKGRYYFYSDARPARRGTFVVS